MYFDPRPKTTKQDLYNRNHELQQFEDTLTYASIIVITGLRRTGKTSFTEVALSQTNQPHIFLDMRDLPIVPARADLIRKIESAFNQLNQKWFTPLQNTLQKIKGVTIAGNTVIFDWSKKGVYLAELFDNIDTWAKKNKHKFLVAFDEIQLIRGNKSIPRLFARIADKNKNTIIVLTGSEVGLLCDFLGFDNPDSPLYGRHYVEIKMQNFKPTESKNFLQKGFEQINIACPEETIDYAAEKLDGTIGWLTLFGAKCRDQKTCSKETVDDVLEEGGRLARREALEVVKFSPRYGIILNFLSTVEKSKWVNIKNQIEVREKSSLANATFTDLITKLVKTSLVEKENSEYRIADPLLRRGVAKEPFPEQSK